MTFIRTLPVNSGKYNIIASFKLQCKIRFLFISALLILYEFMRVRLLVLVNAKNEYFYINF